MTDFDVAIQRLTAWIRDHGDAKPKEFIGDLSIVLLAAKDSRNLKYRLKKFVDERYPKLDGPGWLQRDNDRHIIGEFIEGFCNDA